MTDDPLHSIVRRAMEWRYRWHGEEGKWNAERMKDEALEIVVDLGEWGHVRGFDYD